MRVQGNRWAIVAAMLLMAGCATKPKPAPEPLPTPEMPVAPTTTRGEFTIEADKNETWNAVGQIVVNTPGAEFEGRSQMLDMYTVRYRGVEFLVLTKAMLLSETIRKTTTRVTATTPDGKPIDTNASADLLALLQEKLPAAIIDVQARFAAEAKAKAKSKSKSKAKKKKKKA
ncbi:hypothetical protein [Noviluteimonas gilva]|uniref:Lipoprotein n=1 Tax=Noviluteimonas gilva TaxID=2682097 RepID=A0A7C9M2N8_9GAMM|nr:hypothetical protein [Lysobacter gilvus]MUV13502.1 hypothetical protein [Lysobacter gilvus]